MVRRCAMVLVVFASVWSAVGRDARGGIQYTVTDLGTLGGSESFAYGINDSGQVAGEAVTVAGAAHAFLYSNGTMTDLGTLGGSYSVASGINDGGTIVGSSNTSGGNTHAFLYSNGAMNDLGTFGGSQSFAYGINTSGQVVGGADTTSGSEHAFLYNNGTMTDLGTFGGSNGFAVSINAGGQVAGEYYVGDAFPTWGPSYDAVLYSNGTMTNLGSLPDYSSTDAADINASGQIVGVVNNPGQLGSRAFLYSNGIMTDLGTLGGNSSNALGINASGQVVGSASIVLNNATHAFLYSNGTMTDLNGLVDPNSGWTIDMATAINNSGEIVGYGTNPSGSTDAFLLTPLLPGNANGDGKVDINDLTIVLSNFGQAGMVGVRASLPATARWTSMT